MNIDTMAIPVIALQFAAFGWRINREITVGDEKRKTWLPLADLINIVMLLLIIFSCIVIPITFGGFYTFKRIIMVAAAIFIAFHPITTAGHYGLLSGRGREHYVESKKDYPYATGEELVSFVLSLIITIAFVFFIFRKGISGI